MVQVAVCDYHKMKLVLISYLILGLLTAIDCKSGFLENLEDPDVRAVKMRLTEEKAKRLLLQNDVDVIMFKLEELERTLKGTHKHGETMTTKPEVSFTARLKSHTPLRSLTTIVFNEILHNQGSAYSEHSGIFKAPVAGRYVFALTTMSYQKGKYVHAQIIKNGEEIGRVFTGSNVADWPDTGSVTIVTSLEKNDEVFVREFPDLTGNIHGDSYCTFTGFLM